MFNLYLIRQGRQIFNIPNKTKCVDHKIGVGLNVGAPGFKNIIESSGLEYQSEYKGMPDHISVELEFMQHVVQREAQAWEAGDDETALLCLKNEKQFVAEHLSGWIPDFCEKVSEAAEMPFYREMARLTRSFIEFEKQELKN